MNESYLRIQFELARESCWRKISYVSLIPLSTRDFGNEMFSHLVSLIQLPSAKNEEEASFLNSLADQHSSR
jgi:hypothetical protein